MDDRDEEMRQELIGHERLAQYLCAAHVAHWLGVSFAYALERYVEPEPISLFWLQLAQSTTEASRKAVQQVVRAGLDRNRPKNEEPIA